MSPLPNPAITPLLAPRMDQTWSASSGSDSDGTLSKKDSGKSSSGKVFKLSSKGGTDGARGRAAIPPRRYTCDDCGMTFAKASALAEHVVRSLLLCCSKVLNPNLSQVETDHGVSFRREALIQTLRHPVSTFESVCEDSD